MTDSLTQKILGKYRKIPIESIEIKIWTKQKQLLFSQVPRIIQPKIRFLGQKVCSVARVWTDTHTQTDTHTHESEYRGQPLMVSGFFPSTYHQGSVKKTKKNKNKKQAQRHKSHGRI